MPKRNQVSQLPAKVREQLEKTLLETNFSNYRELAAWLKGQGITVSKSALHRFGASFEQRVNAVKLATDQARAVVSASPDDDNAMNDALIRLVQERVFSVLVDANGAEGAEQIPIPLLGKITKAIADVGRASVQQKKFMSEFRDKLGKSLATKAAAAEKSGNKTKAQTYLEIREEVYGLK